ncbi:molybdopterin-dependent oxidoreductase [Chloroflexota bacterium]
MRRKVILSLTLLISVVVLMVNACGQPPVLPAGEVEATEFLGTKLTPIRDQGNNALKGTQHLDRETYKLTVDGLVENPLTLSYDDLLSYPMESRLITLNCVEGWEFTAKWTGPRLAGILRDTKVNSGANTVIFHTADTAAYTSLELGYILEKGIIIAFKLNDVTLPPERGFPFQVIAEGKYGYKWAKWVTRIELSGDKDFRGFWESEGYSNQADVGGPAFD